MADEEDAYNNSHRAFLQAFLARSVLTFDEIKPILAAILSVHDRRPTLANDITAPDLSAYLATLNARLGAMDLEIRSTRSQHDRTQLYALVNTASDAPTQLATTHSPDEIAFVKRVLDAMFETHNTRSKEVMAVTGMQAARLAKPPAGARASLGGDGEEGAQTQGSAGHGLTIAQAERVMADMVAEGWFEKSRAGYFSLSPRALMELRGWLKDMYNEPAGEGEEEGEGEGLVRVRDCEACREIVTVGQRCSNRDCPCRLHNICTQHFFRSQPNNRRCPRCKAEWTGRDFVGEKAATGDGGAGRRTTAGPSRSATLTNGEVDSGEDEEDDE